MPTNLININEEVLRKVIGFQPHSAQEEILKAEGREVVICAGRRFGKSAVCAYVALKTLLEGDKSGKPVKIWIVSPTYDLSQKVFEYLVKWFLKAAPSQKEGISARPFPQIRTAKGGLVQCKSAENPAGLLGEELDLLIVDEASRIKKNIYETYLYPTTISRHGRIFFISTPFGKNWFYEQWVRAKEHQGAFHFPSHSNPTISPDELERAKKMLPIDVWEQEFLAKFRDSAASVFRNIRSCISDCLKDAQPEHKYIMGLDLAKMNDFSVITVIDRTTHEVVFHDRFQKIPYPLQKERIKTAARKYCRAKIVIDAMNIGAAIGDDLRTDGFMVEDFKSTGGKGREKGTKERLIDKLSSFIEDKNIKIPPIDVLIDELESFGYEMTDSGKITYSAPTGLHDDCVMSLALAVWNIEGKAKQEIIRANQSMPSIKKRFQYR